MVWRGVGGHVWQNANSISDGALSPVSGGARHPHSALLSFAGSQAPSRDRLEKLITDISLLTLWTLLLMAQPLAFSPTLCFFPPLSFLFLSFFSVHLSLNPPYPLILTQTLSISSCSTALTSSPLQISLSFTHTYIYPLTVSLFNPSYHISLYLPTSFVLFPFFILFFYYIYFCPFF